MQCTNDDREIIFLKPQFRIFSAVNILFEGVL